MIDTAQPPVIHLLDPAPRAPAPLLAMADALGSRLHRWGSSEALLAALEPDQPALVLADAGMPGDGAFTLPGTLHRLGIDSPVILFATHADVALCRRAFKAGASDFLHLPQPTGVLVDNLRRVIAGQVLRLARGRDERRARSLYARLSLREKEVLGMVVAGLTNKEIARALAVSPRTVEVHRARLGIKLETESLAQLVRQYAHLVDEDDTAPAPEPPARACGRALGAPLAPAAGLRVS